MNLLRRFGTAHEHPFFLQRWIPYGDEGTVPAGKAAAICRTFAEGLGRKAVSVAGVFARRRCAGEKISYHVGANKFVQLAVDRQVFSCECG